MIFAIDTHQAAEAVYDPAAARWRSYAELAEQVAAVARRLNDGPRSLIFSFCRNDFRSLCVYLAALESGHPIALLDDKLAPEFRTRLIELYSPQWISEGSLPEGEYLHRTESFGGDFHPDLALLLSTSGSTGSPKLVRLTRRNVESNANSIAESLRIESADRAITSLPMHYSYGLSVVNTHLHKGASLVLSDDGLTAPTFWQSIRDHRCTSLAGVPYTYQILQRLKLDGLNVPSLHTLTQAGGKLNSESIAVFSELMKRRGGRFFVMYGQTEATARIAILPSDALPAKLGSAGKPIPGGRIEIDQDTPGTGPEAAGEVVYHGPNVMMGYAETGADLALGDRLGGALRTGDLGYLDADGFLFLTGRAKRDVKLFGLRVNLDEIENLLRVHGPTAAVSKNDAVRIYCEYGDEESMEQYRRDLADRLNINYRAFQFERVDKLPTTANGKIDYQTLVARP